MPFGLVLNPTSDGFAAQLDIADGGTYVCGAADFPPPTPKPAYASSYDTEGAVATEEAHYDNREITVGLTVYGSSAATLETALNALYKMVGQINREGGALKLTTPNNTVCYFDLVPEAAAVAAYNHLYMLGNAAEVELRLGARPFWRGAEISLGTFSETTLPVLVAKVSGAGAAGSYPAEVLADGPAAYLRVGESAGTNANDETANNNDGTYQASPTLGVTGALAGDANTAVTLNGSSQYITVADHATLDLGDTFTLEAWVKRAGTGTSQTIIGKGVNGYQISFETDNTFRLAKQGVAFIVASTVTITDTTTWHHLVATKNGATVKLYIDGVDVTGTVTNATCANTATDLHIGREPGASGFLNGSIDEPAVYPTALSAARVLAHYQAGAGGAAGSIAVDGDVPALGRLVVTDTESGGKDRWTVIVGGQSRYYSSAATAALFYQAEDLTPTGTSTKVAGATGASGAGSNVVRNTDLTTTYQAVLRSEIDATNAALTHKGTYRVWARLYRPTGNTEAVSVRLEWAEGDYTRVTQNDPVVYAADDREGVFTWANLGIVSLDPESTRWEFRLLAKSTVAGDEIDVDCFVLFPTEVTYIELSGLLRSQTPTAYSARDEFDQTAGALTGKTAPVGGVWAGAGDADDFSVETTGKTAQRTAVSDVNDRTGRFAVSGVAAFAAQVVQVDVKLSAYADEGTYLGALARYVDANNWLAATLYASSSGSRLRVRKYVASGVTTLANVAVANPVAATWYTIKLSVDAAGRWHVWYGLQGAQLGNPLTLGQDAALATGGTLASGKPGFYDAHTTSSAATRNYDNFFAFVPTADAAIFAGQSLTLAHDTATREDSTGTFSTKISNRNGRYLKVPPGGPEGRSTRLAILALPNDPYTMGDAAAIYDLSAQLFVTPRGLVVPEA